MYPDMKPLAIIPTYSEGLVYGEGRRAGVGVQLAQKRRRRRKVKRLAAAGGDAAEEYQQRHSAGKPRAERAALNISSDHTTIHLRETRSPKNPETGTSTP